MSAPACPGEHRGPAELISVGKKTEDFDVVGSISWARVAVDVLVAVAVVVFSVVVVVVVVGHASYSLSSSPHHRHSKCTPSAKQPLLYSPGLHLLSHA